MNWKLWHKQPPQSSTPENAKLPKPKDLNQIVGRYLVVTMGKDPDWVWALKEVSRSRGTSKKTFDIRIFDDSKVRGKGVAIKNYLTLDTHPDLILFEGWYDKDTGAIELAQAA